MHIRLLVRIAVGRAPVVGRNDALGVVDVGHVHRTGPQENHTTMVELSEPQRRAPAPLNLPRASHHAIAQREGGQTRQAPHAT